MQIPGLLVEYLINGSLALVWLFPLLMFIGFDPDKIGISSSNAILLIPVLYVLGMVVDSVANFIVRPHKRRILQRAYKRFNISEDERLKIGQFSREAIFIIYAPELAKATQISSSKDRIARSTILNAILLTTTFCLHSFRQSNNPLDLVLYLAGGVTLVLICWGMWARFQYLSYDFELKAYKVLEEKLQYDRVRKGESESDGEVRHEVVTSNKT